MDNKENEKTNNNTVNTDFLSEKIKQRPVNKKKLLRRTLMTAALAVLFGVIACVCIILLEPVISNMLYPKTVTQTVTLPVESEAEEMSPSEMMADDEEILDSKLEEKSQEITAAIPNRSDIEKIIKDVMASGAYRSARIDKDSYESLYDSLQEIAAGMEKSLVKVRGVTSSYDIFNDPYESGGSVTGLVVAKTEEEVLIFVRNNALEDADRIQVTLSDGAVYKAQIKAIDQTSGYAVIYVLTSDLRTDENRTITAATLGSSVATNMAGKPIIAVGAPTGEYGSVCYGAITGSGGQIDLVDSNYQLLTTDIYTTSEASGVLLDLQGKVIGIIDMTYNGSERAYLLSAIGISETRSLIEMLSNGKKKAYLGVHGHDVSQEAIEEYGVPKGAYITSVEIGSPAMDAGLQSGDVIISCNERSTTNYNTLISVLLAASPDEEFEVTYMRRSGAEYVEKTTTVVLTSGN